MGMHWENGDYMGEGMFVWWILFIVIIGGLFTFFIRQRKNGQKKSATAILKERYAQGDISKVEFENKKKDII
jgi:putative membrane protein